MKIFCCDDAKWACNENCMKYEPDKRAFSIYNRGSTKYGTCINYCPFCGSRLPENLIDEKWDTILNELGKEYLPDDDGNPAPKELPKEFKTDEWWKKRGL